MARKITKSEISELKNIREILRRYNYPFSAEILKDIIKKLEG